MEGQVLEEQIAGRWRDAFRDRIEGTRVMFIPPGMKAVVKERDWNSK